MQYRVEIRRGRIDRSIYVRRLIFSINLLHLRQRKHTPSPHADSNLRLATFNNRIELDNPQ